MTAQHSTLPWRVNADRGLYVEDASGRTVVACLTDADATFLVAAVNEATALRAALQAIIDFEPEQDFTPLDNDDCAECAQRTANCWPPSGLCEKHYGVLADRERRNEQRRNYQHSRLRDIARAALAPTGPASEAGAP